MSHESKKVEFEKLMKLNYEMKRQTKIESFLKSKESLDKMVKVLNFIHPSLQILPNLAEQITKLL